MRRCHPLLPALPQLRESSAAVRQGGDGAGDTEVSARLTDSSELTRLCLGAAALSSPEEKATTNNCVSFSRLECGGGSAMRGPTVAEAAHFWGAAGAAGAA